MSYFRISTVAFVILLFILASCQADKKPAGSISIKAGNVVFIHPDGSGASMWGAMRLLKAGPDGNTNWDNLDKMGLYRSHQLNSTNSSSHAGATVHAYGVKVPYNTYGNDPNRPIKSLSGRSQSIMQEALDADIAVAVINSGHICEPGTGVFLASSASRKNTDTIAEQIIKSGADLIFSGGEVMLLPEGEIGRHGKPGIRKDGQNLIKIAEDLGYTVVYNREEMLALPFNADKVLGVFAAYHTFNDMPEEKLAELGLPEFNPEAPTLAEMTDVALKLLEMKQKPFFMVIEEEASDNFSNDNNASGALNALGRADDAIGVIMKYIDLYSNTMLITAADSDAGGMQVQSLRDEKQFEQPLPPTMENGAPLDGIRGTESLPFKTKPDQLGNELYFGISWASYADAAGGIIVKAHGLNAQHLPNNVDNTDIYRMMYMTLFGERIPR